MLFDRREKIYEVVEPKKDTWWEENRLKVMFCLGCLVMYLLLHLCHPQLSQPPDRPHPVPDSSPSAARDAATSHHHTGTMPQSPRR